METFTDLRVLEEERAFYSSKYHYSGKNGGFAEFKADYEKDKGRSIALWVEETAHSDTEYWNSELSENLECIKFFYDTWNKVYKRRKGEFPINLYRAIALDNPKDLNEEDVGICWTWDSRNLDYLVSCLLRDEPKNYEVRLHASANSDNIDWYESVYLFCRYLGSERELRVLNPEEIKLKGYIIFSYDIQTMEYKILKTKGDCKKGTPHRCVPEQIRKKEQLEVDFFKAHPEVKTTGKVTVPSGTLTIYDFMVNSEGKLKYPIESCKGSLTIDAPELKSLEGLPKVVGDTLNITNADITSLEGCPEEVNNLMVAEWIRITSLKGGPKKAACIFLGNNSTLESLEGSPERVEDVFVCADCPKITSLEGGPKYVGRYMQAGGTNISSLEGAPDFVGRGLDLRDTPYHGEGHEKVNYDILYN